MSLLQPPQAGKLVMSFLCSKEKEFAAALLGADQQYGPVDFVSEPLPFTFTRYYEPEMGSGLWRRAVGFEPLIMPDQLVSVKLWSNREEAKTLNERGSRRVNIDPGVLGASNFILATGKNYSHRIYLGQGIYGDLTLIFQKGAFSPLPWTYPDYASPPLLDILGLLRKRYLWQLRHQGEKGKGGKGENI